jgi:hypothetical protein
MFRFQKIDPKKLITFYLLDSRSGIRHVMIIGTNHEQWMEFHAQRISDNVTSVHWFFSHTYSRLRREEKECVST